MTFATASKTVDKGRISFSAFGLPGKVVTDNGPQFVSAEFKMFLSANILRHKIAPHYHPARRMARPNVSFRLFKEINKGN